MVLTKREQYILDHACSACRACALRDAGDRQGARRNGRRARVYWALAKAQSRTDALMCEREALAALCAEGPDAAWKVVQKWIV